MNEEYQVLVKHGNVARYKARLVAQSFSQKYGQDYDEVFAPVVRRDTLRVLLAIASMDKLHIRHVDVKNAYLNGQLQEAIYMRQLRGFETESNQQICLLKKGLYGLKQSGRVWHQKLNEVLQKLGSVNCAEDDCLYIKKTKGEIVYIAVFVDDLMMVGSNEETLIQVKEQLEEHFQLSRLGPLKHFLSLHVRRTSDGKYAIGQASCIRNMIRRFGLEDAKPSNVLLDQGYLSTEDNSHPLNENLKDRAAIGSLLYISYNTRPDIAAATSILAQKVSSPMARDWNEVRRVMRYLKETEAMMLLLGNQHESHASAIYVDPAWEGDCTDRKSNSGYAMFVEGALED